MKKYLMIAAAVLCLAACNERRFHVEGAITEARDSLLVLENVGISDITVVDSVRLDADGGFAFSGEAADAPEFYRLRIGSQIINIAIDSVETVTVRAALPTMATRYEVDGSESCVKIRELALRQMDLQRRAIAVSEDETLGVDAVNDSILAMIDAYKNDVKVNYIFPAPGKSYAYFALFQTLGNMLIFNPRTNKDDIKVYAAVATSWDTLWPEAERGANLHNIAIEGMKNVRMREAQQSRVIDASKVREAGVIDIALRDNKGQMRRLTDLKGSVVLLDFHVFATQESPARILLLRELYNKYHPQGLEVYQVSLDADEHFWKQQTAALPWVSVRDENGLNSSIINMYNIQGLPEYFLIDRGSNLVGRTQTIPDLEQAVKDLL